MPTPLRPLCIGAALLAPVVLGLSVPPAAFPSPPAVRPVSPSPTIPRLLPHQAVRVLPGTDLARVPVAAALDGLGGLAPSASPAKLHTFGELATTEELAQLQQSATVLAGGGYGVVWEEGTFPARDVRMQWLAPDGTKIFPPGGILIASQAADEFNAVIVPRRPEGAYVAFVRDPSTTGGAGQVFVEAFDGTGAALWGQGVPASDLLSAEVHVSPNLLARATGGVFACFSTFNFNSAHDLRCQLLDDLGARQWGTSGQAVGGIGWRVLPRLVTDGNGGLLVFWRNQKDPFAAVLEAMTMEGQRFSPAGARLWGEQARIVRTTNQASQAWHDFEFFSVTSDGSGGAVLSFDDWDGISTTGYDVMAQRVSSEGTTLWGDGILVLAGDVLQRHMFTVGTEDGGAFVAAIQFFSDTHSDLRLFRLAPDGSPLWGSSGVLVSDPAATALDYNLRGWFEGGILRLAWTHQLTPATFEMDVQFAGYRLDGERLGGPAGIALTTAPDSQFLFGFVASTASRDSLAVWNDRRSGSWSNLDVTGATIADTVWLPAGRFFTLLPCRLLDTREPAGPFGGPALQSGEERRFDLTNRCGIPATARSLSVNLTAVSPTAPGSLNLYAGDVTTPPTHLLGFAAGQTRANNAMVMVSVDGLIAVRAQLAEAGSVGVVVDVNGYWD